MPDYQSEPRSFKHGAACGKGCHSGCAATANAARNYFSHRPQGRKLSKHSAHRKRCSRHCVPAEIPDSINENSAKQQPLRSSSTESSLNDLLGSDSVHIESISIPLKSLMGSALDELQNSPPIHLENPFGPSAGSGSLDTIGSGSVRGALDDVGRSGCAMNYEEFMKEYGSTLYPITAALTRPRTLETMAPTT
ncbi:unnamed protein product [Phytophthora lilii]|uniref:Unnamed protein product n=1 Tax=Phytophthora lilii TaxID=2077276 RepID=A0A9W6UB34_9STRA|nr:unnamed protein product [Phytophthora lilii]